MIKLINAIERKLTYTTVQAILIILGFAAMMLLFTCLVVSGNVRQLTCLFTAHVLGALYTYRYMQDHAPETPMGALVTVLFVINGFTALYVPMHVTAVMMWELCSKRKGGSK